MHLLPVLLLSLASQYTGYLRAGFFDTSAEDDGTATFYVTRKFARATVKRQADAARVACKAARALDDRPADYCYFKFERFGDVATVFPDDRVEFDQAYLAAMQALRDGVIPRP